jgi:hypothetical protein
MIRNSAKRVREPEVRDEQEREQVRREKSSTSKSEMWRGALRLAEFFELFVARVALVSGLRVVSAPHWDD